AKCFVVFAVIGASAAVCFSLSRRRRASLPGLEVRELNRRFESLADGLRTQVLERRAFQQLLKERGKHKPDPKRARVYVLDFEGNILGSEVERLREEVTALVDVAGPNDEVVVRLESPGGAVPHYGLAAAQLVRLKDRK